MPRILSLAAGRAKAWYFLPKKCPPLQTCPNRRTRSERREACQIVLETILAHLDLPSAHIPGIKVVMPTTPEDAKGLMLANIRDPSHVIYLEHKMLYGVRGDVPEGDYTPPIGKAAVRREGRDLTIVGCGAMAPKALQAATELAKEGIEAEVIDLRSILPLDHDAILDSVTKTTRLLITHEACRTGGIAGEIAAVVAEKAI